MKMFTLQDRCRSDEIKAMDVFRLLENERRDALWNMYRAERKLRGVRRCWRKCERLHAAAFKQLTALEKRLATREAEDAHRVASLAREQEADDADTAEEERLAVEAAAVRGRLERLEGDLQAERSARVRDRKAGEAAISEMEKQIRASRHRATALQEQLSS